MSDKPTSEQTCAVCGEDEDSRRHGGIQTDAYSHAFTPASAGTAPKNTLTNPSGRLVVNPESCSACDDDGGDCKLCGTTGAPVAAHGDSADIGKLLAVLRGAQHCTRLYADTEREIISVFRALQQSADSAERKAAAYRDWLAECGRRMGCSVDRIPDKWDALEAENAELRKDRDRLEESLRLLFDAANGRDRAVSYAAEIVAAERWCHAMNHAQATIEAIDATRTATHAATPEQEPK